MTDKTPTQVERLLERLKTGQKLDPIEAWKELGISPTAFHSTLTRVKRLIEGTELKLHKEKWNWQGQYGPTYYNVYWIEGAENDGQQYLL